MSWLSTLFTGSNPTLNTQIPALTNTGSTATSLGLNDATTSSNFFRGLLNGNTSVVAPQISSIQKQGSQALQTASQFGNRSGGTNASAQMASDSTRSSINDFIAQLTGVGATSLAQQGTALTNTGINAYGAAANESQARVKNIQDSLLGSGISSGLSTLESFGLGKLLKPGN